MEYWTENTPGPSHFLLQSQYSIQKLFPSSDLARLESNGTGQGCFKCSCKKSCKTGCFKWKRKNVLCNSKRHLTKSTCEMFKIQKIFQQVFIFIICLDCNINSCIRKGPLLSNYQLSEFSSFSQKCWRQQDQTIGDNVPSHKIDCVVQA